VLDPAPEPSYFALFGLAAVATAFFRRRTADAK
jgi:PEP-CTERM motif